MKDLLIGLCLGALTSFMWVTLHYNETTLKSYKEKLSAQSKENVYLRNELVERNNELLKLYQFNQYLKKQYGLPEHLAGY